MKLSYMIAWILFLACASAVAADQSDESNTKNSIEPLVKGCIQDQYGNQYRITVDSTTNYVTGSVTISEVQCNPGTRWPILGSYSAAITDNGTQAGLELTAVNPEGFSSGCVPAYKLKGIYPNFQWYYIDGPGLQPGTFVSCSEPVTPAIGRGTRKQ